MKTFRNLCLSLITIGTLGLAQSAQALDFNFSLTNSVGTVEGTVTGTIKGLSDNATGPASEVVLTGIPETLALDMGISPDYALFGNGWSELANSFTVEDGAITAISFYALDGGSNQFELLDGDPFALSGASQSVAAPSEIANLNLTQAVPEPGTYALGLFSALALLFAWRRKSLQA